MGKLFKGKKGNAIIIIAVIIALLFILSTQKVVVNETQLKTATPTTCGLIGMAYDEINKVCVQKGQNATKTDS